MAKTLAALMLALAFTSSGLVPAASADGPPDCGQAVCPPPPCVGALCPPTPDPPCTGPLCPITLPTCYDDNGKSLAVDVKQQASAIDHQRRQIRHLRAELRRLRHRLAAS